MSVKIVWPRMLYGKHLKISNYWVGLSMPIAETVKAEVYARISGSGHKYSPEYYFNSISVLTYLIRSCHISAPSRITGDISGWFQLNMVVHMYRCILHRPWRYKLRFD